MRCPLSGQVEREGIMGPVTCLGAERLEQEENGKAAARGWVGLGVSARSSPHVNG
jgi:hypothetical protein